MEELSALCGRPCWRWKDSMTMQEKEMKERWPWRKLSSGSTKVKNWVCRQNEIHTDALQITRERATQTLSLPATPPGRKEDTREESGGRGAEISPERSLEGTKVIQWRGRRISISPGRACGCCAGTSSTSKEFGLNDVWRSPSGPSRPFSLGPSGVACSCVLCCRSH